MMNTVANSFLAILLISLSACKPSVTGEEELLVWIGKEKNGFTKEKKIGDILLKAKLMPAEFNVYREISAMDQNEIRNIDSMVNANQANICFLLTIRTTNDKEDIMYKDISTPEELDARARELNFNLAEYISLEINNKEVRPVHASIENTYSLSSYRNFYIVFSPQTDINELKSAKEFTLIFNDRIFGTGISKFHYNKKKIKLPKVVWKNI